MKFIYKLPVAVIILLSGIFLSLYVTQDVIKTEELTFVSEAPKPTKAPEIDESEAVYTTKNGKSYHLKTCKTISKSKNLKRYSISQAKQKKYKPCKVCCPD